MVDDRSDVDPEDFPGTLHPMMAVAGDLPPPGAPFAYEFKWDGVRAAAFVRAGAVRLRSRNDNDMTSSYPELAVLGELTDGRAAVLDGEIVAFDDAGRPSFGVLQSRMHVRRPGRELLSRTPVVYCLFDITHLDGWSTRRMSYVDRRALLESLGLVGPAVQVPPYFLDAGEDVLAASLEHGLEGVMAKRLDSPYLSGRRSDLWRKVKHSRAQEVVIGGWKPGSGRRTGTIGSLLLGVPDPSGLLRYVGHVGTGFTERTLRDLLDRLTPLERPKSPFTDTVPRAQAQGTHWVEPTLVGEVRFAEWTRDGVLRHPSWRGLRPDKRPDQIHLE